MNSQLLVDVNFKRYSSWFIKSAPGIFALRGKKNASKLLIIRGPSGSGKSTVARELFARSTRPTLLVSEDYVRKMFSDHRKPGHEGSIATPKQNLSFLLCLRYMLKINITNEEKILLRQHHKNSSILLVQLKAHAVLMWSNGLPDSGVADVVGRGERQVMLWRRAWNNYRMASIFSGHARNTNASKLTKDQQQQIKEILSRPPSELGIPKAFWDVPTLKNYILATFDVIYESDESYYFLLRFSGLSFKYPSTFDVKRNEELILARMEAIRTEIKPLLHSNNWEVFAVDEVKMQQDAIIRRAWLKKGQRTIIKINRDKQSQSYIGFLNQRSFACHLYEMGWQNSDEVLKAFKQFLKEYPNKQIAIIWDNAPFHKSRQIKQELKRTGLLGRVHLIAMPPYAPDENPIEHVWNTAKKAVSNIQQDTFSETKKAFYDFVTQRSFAYSF